MERTLIKVEGSTKTCPNCGSTVLVSIGTYEIKMCNDCPTNIYWPKGKDEPAVYGGPHREDD